MTRMIDLSKNSIFNFFFIFLMIKTFIIIENGRKIFRKTYRSKINEMNNK